MQSHNLVGGSNLSQQYEFLPPSCSRAGEWTCMFIPQNTWYTHSKNMWYIHGHHGIYMGLEWIINHYHGILPYIPYYIYMWIRLTSFLIVYLCSESNVSVPMSPNLWSSSAAYFLRRRADLQLGLEPYRRSERSLKGLHRNVQCELNVHCSLYTNHTPHAWRPQVAVALPTTGAPSTGSRVSDSKSGI